MLKEKPANPFEKQLLNQSVSSAKVVKPQVECKTQKAKKGGERSGDWICQKCSNHNYSFRSFCNRCNLSQTLSIEMQTKKAPFKAGQMATGMEAQTVSTPFNF